MINKNTTQKTNPCGHTDEQHKKMQGQFNPLLEKMTIKVLEEHGSELMGKTAEAIKELEELELINKKERIKAFKLLFPIIGTIYTQAYMEGMKYFSKLEDNKIKIYE